MTLLSAILALFRCQHDWGWPFRVDGQILQGCLLCGKTRESCVDLRPSRRYDVPRFEPRAVEETGIERVQREAAEELAKDIATLERMYGGR